MKTLHLDGIGGRAKPQFLRGRCHDSIGCEKRMDRRSSALNGKFHKRVVAHHDLICVIRLTVFATSTVPTACSLFKLPAKPDTIKSAVPSSNNLRIAASLRPPHPVSTTPTP